MAISDKITDVRNSARPNSAKVTASRSAGVTTLSCDNLAGWPTASAVHFATYQVDTNNDPVAGTQVDWKGLVSGNNIGTLTLKDGTDAGNSVGDIVEMLPTAAWGQDLADALTVGHTRAGVHASALPLNAPVLTAPVIADFTSATHNHSNAAGGAQLTAAAFANNAITAPLLATSAIKLGSNTNTSSPTIVSGAAATTVCTVTVTIPAGGRDVEVIGQIPYITAGGAAAANFVIDDGTTTYQTYRQKWPDAGFFTGITVYALVSAPAAGSKTFNLKATADGAAANIQINNTATQASILTVKAI